MKRLEYWEVLYISGEEDETVNTQRTPDSPEIEQVGKFRMERMQTVMKDHIKHAQWGNRTTVLQTNSKIRN